MKRIKIGHLGTFHDHSCGKLLCIRKFPEVFELVGVVAENEEQKKKCMEMPSYQGVTWMSEEELFSVPGLSAVMVETDELSLIAQAQKCIDHGLHVHIDKPAGESINNFERLLSSAKEKKLTVQMAYMYRYNPAIQKALDITRSGKLGEIYQVNAIMNTGHNAEKREWLAKFKGGIMFFLGCHMVDLALLFRGEPKKIIPYNYVSGFEGTSSLDNCRAVFEYDNGISLVESTAVEINGFGRRQLVVCGSKGTLSIEPLETVFSPDVPTKLKLTLSEYAQPFQDKSKVLLCNGMTGRYDEMMMDFVKMVCGEKENPYSYEYELMLQKTVLKACGII